MEDAERALLDEIELIKSKGIDEKELEKVKNRVESQTEFAEMELLHKAMGLAYAELLGDANLVNEEKKFYAAVSAQDILNGANEFLVKENCSTLYYYAN